METLPQEDREKLRLLFVAAVNQWDFFYLNYQENFWVLVNYLYPEKGMLSAYNVNFPSSFHADCCPNCCSYFGDTVGGRLREGCHHCRSSRRSMSYFFYNLAPHLGISHFYMQALVADAIRDRCKIRKELRG